MSEEDFLTELKSKLSDDRYPDRLKLFAALELIRQREATIEREVQHED